MNKNKGTKELLPLAKSLQKSDKFVITDSDLIPYETTPVDILNKMKNILDANDKYNHVGASLEINDLPDWYPLKQTVIRWESQYWKRRLKDGYFDANVDTTFAMYRGGANVRKTVPAIRLDRPYTFKHTDWYLNPKTLNSENIFYLATCNNFATWSTLLNDELNNVIQ